MDLIKVINVTFYPEKTHTFQMNMFLILLNNHLIKKIDFPVAYSRKYTVLIKKKRFKIGT